MLPLKTRIKLFHLMPNDHYGIHKCGMCGKIDEPIFKMGGLICTQCRLIIVYPGEPGYAKRMEQDRRKWKKQDAIKNS